MTDHKQLLENNKAWAAQVQLDNPNFFEELAKGQTPRYLWIGCSDSRVPAEQVTGLRQGDIFVHRNIANMAIHTDVSMQSVLQYAVEVLEIEHVIVCGHYQCGGVQTAMTSKSLGLIDNWLRHIKDVYRMHASQLDNISSEEERFRKLVELNALEQIQHIAATATVQRAWATRKGPQLHAWVHDIRTGLLSEIATVGAVDAEIYSYNLQ